jgi:signal transduction histidine kinase
MNGIIGMTELALETPLSAEQREYLKLVHSSALGLLTIINDILDFSKIEAGKLELEAIEMSLHETLRDTLKALTLKAHEKGIELICDIDPSLPDRLVGDPVRLRQVVTNLVGNAIKFTDRGEITLTADLKSVEGENINLHFAVKVRLHLMTVIIHPNYDSYSYLSFLFFSPSPHAAAQDTGIGIPSDKLNVIFEAFSQADGSITRRYGGTGLGLTISTRLVRLMGGEMTAESQPGVGSTFHFTARFGLPHNSNVANCTRPLPSSLSLSFLLIFPLLCIWHVSHARAQCSRSRRRRRTSSASACSSSTTTPVRLLPRAFPSFFLR